jgi:hypothetical protein
MAPTASRCAIRAKGKKGQETDARGVVASTIPFSCPTASDLDGAPEHWISLSPSLCFRSLPSYEGLRNRGQDLGALHKATRDPLTPSLSSLPLTSCSSTSALLQPSINIILSVQGRVGASVALPPPHHTFPSNSTSNREIPPRWPLAGNTTPARPAAHHFIVDVGYSADTPVH